MNLKQKTLFFAKLALSVAACTVLFVMTAFIILEPDKIAPISSTQSFSNVNQNISSERVLLIFSSESNEMFFCVMLMDFSSNSVHFEHIDSPEDSDIITAGYAQKGVLGATAAAKAITGNKIEKYMLFDGKDIEIFCDEIGGISALVNDTAGLPLDIGFQRILGARTAVLIFKPANRNELLRQLADGFFCNDKIEISKLYTLLSNTTRTNISYADFIENSAAISALILEK